MSSAVKNIAADVTSGTTLSCLDPSFASAFSFPSDILSSLLETQPPPDPEPDILPSTVAASHLPMLSSTSTYPPNSTNQINKLIAASTIYPRNSTVNQLPSVLPRYLGLEPSPLQSCSFLDEFGLFAGAEMAAATPELRAGAPEVCGLGIYGQGSMRRAYSSGDLQVLGDSQHAIAGRNSSPALSQVVASDFSVLDDSSYKVGRLSIEERKEKIHRYMKKRNERNFSKKIKYACRKTLADSRPRVRGRFAKNDEFGDAAPRLNSVHQEYDDDEEMLVKEEEMLQSDILAHITGVNSFKYNYTVESWI